MDRDIAGSDSAVGIDSAVRYAVGASTSCGSPARSLLGRASSSRHSGHHTASSPRPSPPPPASRHVLVPERDIDLDGVAAGLRELAPSGSAIAVMSEAVGDAVRIAKELAARSGVRVHPTILGHAQRAAPPSAHDLTMGRAAGRAAAEALADGRSAFVTLGDDGAVTPVPWTQPQGAFP